MMPRHSHFFLNPGQYRCSPPLAAPPPRSRVAPLSLLQQPGVTALFLGPPDVVSEASPLLLAGLPLVPGWGTPPFPSHLPGVSCVCPWLIPPSSPTSSHPKPGPPGPSTSAAGTLGLLNFSFTSCVDSTRISFYFQNISIIFFLTTPTATT